MNGKYYLFSLEFGLEEKKLEFRRTKNNKIFITEINKTKYSVHPINKYLLEIVTDEYIDDSVAHIYIASTIFGKLKEYIDSLMTVT